MDAEDIFSVADLLAKTNTPAANRSSISRAYYAIYHSGLLFFEKQDLGLGAGPSAHANLEACFNNANLKEIREQGVKLGKVKTLRTKADYELGQSGRNTENPATVIEALSEARAVIAKLSEITLSDEQKKELHKKIEEHNIRGGKKILIKKNYQ